MQTIWKGCSVCVLLFALMMMFVVPAHAETTDTKATTGSSIKDKLSSTDGLEKEVDKSTNTFVDRVRHISIFGSIIFGVWLAICFLGAGFSPDILRQTKIQAIAFVAFLAMAFWTEPILGTILGIFNVDVADILK